MIDRSIVPQGRIRDSPLGQRIDLLLREGEYNIRPDTGWAVFDLCVSVAEGGPTFYPPDAPHCAGLFVARVGGGRRFGSYCRFGVRVGLSSYLILRPYYKVV